MPTIGEKSNEVIQHNCSGRHVDAECDARGCKNAEYNCTIQEQSEQTMQGRRIQIETDEQGNAITPMKPGDYGKWYQNWLLCVPSGLRATIKTPTWIVTEHEDGTITISPSIDVKSHIAKYSWHGFLEKGIWREC